MKVAAIIYHKDILSIYQREWIEKSFNSILYQTYSKFSIYELNYGTNDLKLYREYPNNKEYHYYKIPMNNHAEAMNFLMDECLKDGCDVVFNNNLDDINHIERFKTQIKCIKRGFELVSSNFEIIDENDNVVNKMNFSSKNINDELKVDHNIICHPSVCYSRNFIEKNKYLTNEIPFEDMNLWKRTINDYKFFICPEYLLSYRKHSTQVTKLHEKPEIKEEVNNFQFQNNFVNTERCKFCGEIKDKIKYNFCQKCNTIY